MNRRNVIKPLLVVGILSICSFFIWGCLGGSSSGGTVSNPTGGMITGRVTASGSISLTIKTQASLRAEAKISKATVWLEEDYEVKSTTDSDGFFALTPVPYGDQRVVAKLTKTDGQTYKVRSEEIGISSDAPTKDVGSIELESAQNKVQGVLLDSQGNPVPNATLYLWGEPFETDEFGRYYSPPLPDSTPVEEIKMAPVVGLASQSIIAPFTAKGEGIIVTTLTVAGDNNHPPRAWLTSENTGGDKVGPGERVSLWAVYFDPDTDDRSTLVESWTISGGKLASSSAPFPEDLKRRVRTLTGNVDFDSVKFSAVEWTAPSEKGNFKIDFVVKDSAGASGHTQYVINMGNDAPVNNPPQAVISASGAVVSGKQLSLEVIANDADLDILTFKWSVTPNAGSIAGIGSPLATWTAPTAIGNYVIQCQVQEAQEKGLSVIASKTVRVVADPIEVSKGRIAGHVLDENTDVPIAGALVGIAGTSHSAITDSTGFFEFSGLPPGTYDLVASRDGYKGRTFRGIVVP